jgi:hypothetical protein
MSTIKLHFVSWVIWLVIAPGVYSQSANTLSKDNNHSPVTYHLSFDDRKFFEEDFIESSGKKTIEERKIDFPQGRFGKGIRMKEIPETPDANNMTGIDLDLVTAVIFNTHPGNQMGFNQPFIWGSGRVNARLGSLAFWARGELPFAGPLFEQTSVGFGRKERDLLGILVDEDNHLSAYIRDARYVTHQLKTASEWNTTIWNHVVLNWDWANGMELWINGEKVASSWGQQTWFETSLPGLFHLPAAGLTYDEFYLFDRPITQLEVQKLMNSNTPPGNEPLFYDRQITREKAIVEASGANYLQQLPSIHPNEFFEIQEVWPEQVGDGFIPGWHVIDGRNEIAWPHPYSMFTIIPGDADFHAEKVDISTNAKAKVNYLALTGNLTNVQVQASTPRSDEPSVLLEVPSGNQFLYASTIELQQGASFRIPFTEKYGTPKGFSGNVHLPLSGEKRIQNVGLYQYRIHQEDNSGGVGKKLQLGKLSSDLDSRTQFAIQTLTTRDERQLVLASSNQVQSEASEANIGHFSRVNFISEPYETDRGIKSITLSLPIQTKNKEEPLYVRVRDPGVPSRFWNQFAIKLNGFDREYETLNVSIDFQDLVLTGGDRLWVDIGTAGETKIRLGDPENQALLYVDEADTYQCVDAYAEKEIISARAQYSKMYEFMPWQFTGRTVSLTNPYCYGGPFDMIMPALAINRVKPDHFISNYLIKVCGSDFKDGKPITPQSTPLVTLPNPLGAPEWALYMRDFNLKRTAVVDWWSNKQNPDGQLGGGWNDDVLFLSYHQPDLPLDGNDKARYLIDAAHKGLEKTNYFKDGYCNIYPMDRMHIGDFISERYNTVLNNLGQAYAFERELESAWRLDKVDETPINYFADGFKSSVNIVEWFWGNDVPNVPYISKDLDSLTNELRLYTSVLDEQAFFRFTASNVHRDDFSPYGANNMYTYLLGGRRGSRLDAHMKLAVTWPSGGGADVPRVILYADDSSLEALAYSFDSEKRDLLMRLCRIKNGHYRVSMSKTNNNGENDGQLIWQTEMDLKRFDVISLPIPPQTAVRVKVEQLARHDQSDREPDLAIDPWDAVYVDGSVACTIHNLGDAAAKDVTISLYNGELLLQEMVIDDMPAPTDFVEKKKAILFENVSFTGNLQVVIDAGNNIQEILEDNNRAMVYKEGSFTSGLAPKGFKTNGY